MRRVPIRLKLAGALAVPLPALVAVALFEVADTAADRSGVRQQTELAIATTGPTGVVTALQNERAWLAVELVGFDDIMTVPVEGYDETRSATDAAIDNFRADLEGRSPVIAEAYDEALAGLAELDEVRADVDANTAPRDIENLVFSDLIFTRYTGLVEPFLDATARISLGVDDQELRHGTRLAHTTAEQIEVMNQLLNMIIRDGGYNDGISTPPEIVAVTQLRARFEDNAARLMTAVGPYGPIIAEHFPADVTERVVNEIHRVVAVELIEDVRVVVEAFDAPADAGYPALQEALSAEIDRRAGQLNRSAAARQRWFVGLAVLALGGTWVLAWAVARSITGPLRSLTRQAVAMAQDHLPRAVRGILDTPLGSDVAVPEVEPVRVSTRDEVADVADALNTVQNTALQLASEQAVLRRNIADSFVNLGRRNQNLLGRQLDFITELETNEADADALANLFRLDHLATRMRRNAESLLVLAGIEPPRQWAAPVRLTDVIRAALGEVEDYQRVTVRGVEPATIIGSAAADLAHLMAELIENALVFSPPDQTVDIRGRIRNDGGYTLAIIDSGLGMPATDVAAANRRLAGAESFTIAPSKYLGHYVAGNLAARHDIKVHLDNSPSNGVTATITVPPMLLTTEQVTAAPVTPPHGHQLAQARALAPPQPAPLPPSPPQHLPDAASADDWPVPQLPRAAAPHAQPPAPPVPPPAPPAPAPATAAQPLPSLWPRSLPLSQGQRGVAGWGSPAPNGGAPDAGAAGHGIGNGAAPPPTTTPGGLARRAPGPGVTSAAAPVDDNLLAALGRYTSPRPVPGAPGQQPGGGLAPPAASAPAPSPLTPPDALTRRVKGAQLPQSAMISLRGGRVEPPPRPALDPLSPGASKATDVQALLSSFTAGVRRGLDEARQRAAHATGPLSTVDSAPRRAGW